MEKQRANILAAILSTLLLVSLFGCSKSSDEFESVGQSSLSLKTVTLSGTTSSSGSIEIFFPIEAGSSAFSLSAFSIEDAFLTFDNLTAPNGAVLIDANDIASFSGQEIFNASPIAINYPSSPSKFGKLTPGSYKVRIIARKKTSSNFLSHVPVALSIVTKFDSGNFQSKATVNINALLAGSLAGDQNNRTSIESAFAKAQGFFDKQNIQLAINIIRRSDLPSLWPNPSDPKNNSIYQDLSNQYPQTLVLLFAVEVEKLSSPDNAFAQSGFSPLPAIPSSRSAIAFSARNLSGSDGEFDKDRGDDDLNSQQFSDETLHMANVIAHEIGHALGLSNSVTLKGDVAVDSDTLSDTDSCIDKDSCESQRDVNNNIMFPYSLREDGSGNKFWSRDSISDQQGIIMKQNVLVQVN